jgi:hypothetical protein
VLTVRSGRVASMPDNTRNLLSAVIATVPTTVPTVMLANVPSSLALCTTSWVDGVFPTQYTPWRHDAAQPARPLALMACTAACVVVGLPLYPKGRVLAYRQLMRLYAYDRIEQLMAGTFVADNNSDYFKLNVFIFINSVSVAFTTNIGRENTHKVVGHEHCTRRVTTTVIQLLQSFASNIDRIQLE